MKRLTAFAVACTFAFSAAAASGHGYSQRTLSDRHVGAAKVELVAQLHFSSRVVAAATSPRVRWKLALRHASCWSHVPWSRVCNRARARLLAHRWLAAVAQRRLARLYPPPPAIPRGLLAAFTCIHGYEGAWDSNTGNGYYGGLQMDLGFQSLYGPDFLARFGTADNWPIVDQLIAAMRAYNSGRGFGPWPNTARACGLL